MSCIWENVTMCLCSCVHWDTKTSDSIYKKTCVRRKTKLEQNWVVIHQCGEVNRGELFRAEYTGRGEVTREDILQDGVTPIGDVSIWYIIIIAIQTVIARNWKVSFEFNYTTISEKLGHHLRKNDVG